MPHIKDHFQFSQLNDQLKLENEKRRQECKELFDMLAKEREKTSEDLLRETSQVRDLMKKDQIARDDEKRFKDKEVIIWFPNFNQLWRRKVFDNIFLLISVLIFKGPSDASRA